MKEILEKLQKEMFAKGIDGNTWNEFMNGISDSLGAESERFEVEEDTNGFHFHVNNDHLKVSNPIVNLSTLGNVQIGRAEIDPETQNFSLDVLVPGVKDGDIELETFTDKLSISLDKELTGKYSNSFSLSIKSNVLDFINLQACKNDGILSIIVPGKKSNQDQKTKYYI